jgi:hypothetical protein
MHKISKFWDPKTTNRMNAQKIFIRMEPCSLKQQIVIFLGEPIHGRLGLFSGTSWSSVHADGPFHLTS